jgi:hypothetical protein
MFHRRRDRFKFTEKRHSRIGMVTLAIAAVLLICYIIFLVLAFQGAGSLSAYYGSAGVLAMLMALVNLGFSIRSLFEEDSFQLFPRMSLAVSLIAVTCWVGTYAAGFLIS